jgi:uncharacterized protein
MQDKIFVSLPVEDIDASKAFLANLGHTFNPQFTDVIAACMVISENIFAMLITHPASTILCASPSPMPTGQPKCS